MYDFAHPIQDALEGITHSLCSLEFEAHRPLYDWVVQQHRPCPASPGRSSLPAWASTTRCMSKRKLRKLVEEDYVSGWDDPRMPTLCGLRRRGYTPASIRNFCERIGVAKADLHRGVRLLGALPAGGSERARPAGHGGAAPASSSTITNYPEGQSETFEVENNPNDPGRRHPHSHLLPRPVYRGGGLPGDARSPSTSVSTPAARSAA